MDFIYSLDGISKTKGNLPVQFHRADGDIDFTPAALHVDGRSASETIFGDEFAFLEWWRSRADAEADDPVPEAWSTTAAGALRSTRTSTRSWTPSGPT